MNIGLKAPYFLGFILALVLSKAVGNPNYRASNFAVKQNQVYVGQTSIQNTSETDVITCAFKCNDKASCVSANFDRKIGRCQLMASAVLDGSSSLINKHGNFYIEKVTTKQKTATPVSSSASTAVTPTTNTTTSSSSFCKGLLDTGSSIGSTAYKFEYNSGSTTPVYCEMGVIPGCGGGGWTLVMKINGAQNTFKYDSYRWTDKNLFHPDGGRTGFYTLAETKLPTYWSTAFTTLCVGMRQPSIATVRWLKIDRNASSLHALLSDGVKKVTNLGVSNWKALYPAREVLQNGCHIEGFDVYGGSNTKARIGVVGDDDSTCSTPDSVLGIGTQGWWSPSGVSCGSGKNHNGKIENPTWCFVFVQ